MLLILVRQKRNFEKDLIIIKVHTSPIEKNKVSQQRFHEHYGQHSHNEIDDWQFLPVICLFLTFFHFLMLFFLYYLSIHHCCLLPGC